VEITVLEEHIVSTFNIKVSVIDERGNASLRPEDGGNTLPRKPSFIPEDGGNILDRNVLFIISSDPKMGQNILPKWHHSENLLLKTVVCSSPVGHPVSWDSAVGIATGYGLDD
jgi:hypothetical protein